MAGGPLTRTRTVSRDGIDLAVFEGGVPAGPTLVMVHGWPDTHHMWRGVAECLEDEFHLVAYDTRGQGESPSSAPDAAFSVHELAADLHAVLDATSPSSSVHLLAHDWGSVQAWEAVCRPGADQRIASFTSMSGPHLGHLGALVRRTLARPGPAGVAALVAQAVSSSYVPFLVSPLAPPVLDAIADRQRWRSLIGLAAGRPPVPGTHADTLARDMVSGLRYYRATLARPRSHELRTEVPVLQLELPRDLAVRHAALVASDRWTTTLDRHRLPYGHWVALTHPEVVAAEVAGFVRSQRGRRSPRDGADRLS
jgi:pimeloyl-ACP methyl ester carboxylesterase